MEDLARPRTVVRQRAGVVHRALPKGIKRAFEIDEMFRRLRKAVKPYTPAAMFELYDQGYTSVFEILLACIISIRTYEEVTIPTARKLFAVARTPKTVSSLSEAQIDRLIHSCTFHGPKARTIRQIARDAVRKFDGELPCDFEALTSLHGVGPKCANLVLGIVCQQARGVAVDIHVHRVTNRWGYVSTSTPERTMIALEAKLPRKYWIEINKLLVPFGKFICTAKLPKCSTCPLLEFCHQVSVSAHR